MSEKTLENFFASITVTPDIIGRKHFQNAAVLVPFIKIENEYHILFEKRANHIRQGGEISFPGGMINSENGESSQDAAIRETREELGVEEKNIRVFSQFHTLVAAHGTILDVFIGELCTQPKHLVLNKNEVEKVFTVPISFFLQTKPQKFEMKVTISPFDTDENGNRITLFPAAKLKLPERYHQEWSRKNTTVYLYQFNEEIIWGMTAQILVELVPIIEEFYRFL